MLSKLFGAGLFEKLGFTRDDLKWDLSVISAIVIGLASFDVTGAANIGISPAVLPYLRLGAVIIGIISAKMGNSALPGKDDADKIFR